jgi:hypothetical protein
MPGQSVGSSVGKPLVSIGPMPGVPLEPATLPTSILGEPAAAALPLPWFSALPPHPTASTKTLSAKPYWSSSCSFMFPV